jgi:RNA polymerase sigma-70 factor, ECF subfamily
MHDFEEMYRRHYPDVYRFALFLTGNPDTAEDLAADTFVRAWTARGRLRYASVRPYLFAITRNLHRDQLRQTRTLVELPLDTRDTACGPDEQAHHAQAIDQVRRCLHRVSRTDRRALLLHVLGELSYRQVAHVLGITVGAVKSRINRARVALSGALTSAPAEHIK